MCDVLRLGDMVPALDIEVYNPKDHEFGVVSLEQLRKDGQWAILVFYPADFTFVCPTELADLGGHYEEFRKLGAELISVSTCLVTVAVLRLALHHDAGSHLDHRHRDLAAFIAEDLRHAHFSTQYALHGSPLRS